ncbi:xanthine dehydrogenase family protein molybdopterin-binding subunit [Thermus thermamylovorans]|uniref:Xanthine dehydrogenase family protein molybdopterin-binding subunit n=1 Tax=Thermus thermamylovorans TaxID=2509362 RepID=A0A4Q9B4T1_9DEIN|nr:xanthine dehydrogenase family protein molybdopterin-binding subunit [Thermus thermamylovorans]TBH20949.1 xanthine dehydrogenase family protein molybdopterin-binding subunit [Thermus thermamylovorans]
MAFVGQAVKRKEDLRFLTGKGTYVDDIVLPGTVHVAFVRSPYAHARIQGVRVEKALQAPGVLRVLTGEDFAREGVRPMPVGWLLPTLRIPPRPVVAKEEVHHVGEVVAVVVAETRAQAEDAALLVEVDYEPLPAVADVERALAPGAPQLHSEAPGNVAFTWEIGDAQAVEEAFRKAHKVVRLKLRQQRLIPNAIEPRASLAQYHPGTGEYTLYTTSQNPHVHRLMHAAFILGIPEHKLRVVAPDVGGGFGSKIFPYPEETAVLLAARLLGRPVRWTARRSESFVSDAQGRDHATEAEMALDGEGRILALRVRTLANMGAYLSLFAPAIPTYLYGTLLSGQYRIPAIHAHVTGVLTNTVPVDAYRGAGRPEACYLLERLVDLAAQELGLDPAEIRRQNYIPKDAFPYPTPVALVYDSGDYAAALDKALELLGYETWRREQEELRKQGRYLGIGLASYIEACGLAPSKVVGQLGAQAGLWESALIRVAPTGKVEVYTGSHSHGQGHETAFAQVVADLFGVGLEDVEIVHGDTGRIPFGMGTYGSRSAPVGAAAIYRAAEKVLEKARHIAAHLLEVAPEDLEFREGRFEVKGVPGRGKTFQEVALQAYLAHNLPEGMEPGLEASAFFDPANFVFPFGTHAAVVEVDPDTGEVKLLRYVAVDDCGNQINPLLVRGQVEGGVAQGIGQALLEEAFYDEGGQLLTGTYMEYAMPRAHHLPRVEHGHTVTPTPVNPLGVKGVGEAGTIVATAAVANAVMDALRPFGIRHLDIPLTPEKVWRAIREKTPAAAD